MSVHSHNRTLVKKDLLLKPAKCTTKSELEGFQPSVPLLIECMVNSMWVKSFVFPQKHKWENVVFCCAEKPCLLESFVGICKEPGGVPPYRRNKYNGPYNPGSKVLYLCHQRSECQSNGSWSRMAANCTGTKCPL